MPTPLPSALEVELGLEEALEDTLWCLFAGSCTVKTWHWQNSVELLRGPGYEIPNGVEEPVQRVELRR